MDALEKLSQNIDLMLQSLGRIEKILGDAPRRAAAPLATVANIAPAPDADLDGQYGDFVSKKDPPRYKGPSFAGKPLSQTSPEFCDAVMSFKLWQAGKDAAAGDETKAGYARRDAERALGWKLRLEGGYKPPEPKDEDFGF